MWNVWWWIFKSMFPNIDNSSVSLLSRGMALFIAWRCKDWGILTQQKGPSNYRKEICVYKIYFPDNIFCSLPVTLFRISSCLIFNIFLDYIYLCVSINNDFIFHTLSPAFFSIERDTNKYISMCCSSCCLVKIKIPDCL